MKYSKGVETTTRQILYLKLSISLGIYRSSGLAWMAKSMHDFWKLTRTRELVELLVAITYLILVDLSVLELGLALLLKGDDDQGHEDVDEEKREDDEEHDIEDGHFDAEERYGALVLVSGGHRMLQHARR